MTKSSIDSILLVEDNLGDARLLREILHDQRARDTGLVVVHSMSAAEAHLAAHTVDIILLDLGLPDAHGVSALRRVRAAAPGVPVVVLTGLDDEAMATQALQEGAQDYLIKGQLDTYGSTRGLVHALRCAVERKLIEDALFVEKERAQVTLDCIGEGVICTDGENNVTFLNVVAERLTGWSRQDALGRPMSEVLQVKNATASETPICTAEHAGKCGAAERAILVRRDGLEIPVEESIAPIQDREGKDSGAVIVFRDVSVARAMAAQIAHSAEHDFLTGLPNRMRFNDRVDQAIAIAPRHARQVAVLFLDLDGFKHINDSLGHQVGDQVLQSVATRLSACVRASDTVCRQGGDEFVVLLSDVDRPEHVAVTARRMLREVAKAHSVDGGDIHLTTSIGVSVYPDDGSDADTLIKNADTAMYQVKETGRQKFLFFTSAMNRRAVERQTIEEGLRRALEREEFALHYQPKVNLKTGAITGVEALLRWESPTLGFVSPAHFIPVAEACGLIRPIGAWVLREACTQAQAWVKAGLPITTMAVNVSVLEFQNDKFLASLLEILEETGFAPTSLELELTESVLMKHAESTIAVLNILRERGVRVVIDDFGTGYSSLSYLRKFPVDALKIDQSFIHQISMAGADTAIVKAVISMARSLKMRVIAEGVETLEQLSFLRANRCDEGQGHYFSRPMQAKQCAQMLRAGSTDGRSHASAPVASVAAHAGS